MGRSGDVDPEDGEGEKCKMTMGGVEMGWFEACGRMAELVMVKDLRPTAFRSKPISHPSPCSHRPSALATHGLDARMGPAP